MIYVLLAIAGGLLMDLAIFERLKLSLAGIWSTREELSYRSLLFPRITLTVISSALIGFALQCQPENVIAILAGSVILAISLAYAAYLILSKEFY